DGRILPRGGTGRDGRPQDAGRQRAQPLPPRRQVAHPEAPASEPRPRPPLKRRLTPAIPPSIVFRPIPAESRSELSGTGRTKDPHMLLRLQKGLPDDQI